MLNAAKLLEIIERPGFELFLRYIRRFGVWASFKINFVKAMKSGRLEEVVAKWEEGPPPEAPPTVDPAEARIADLVAARVEARIDRLLARRLPVPMPPAPLMSQLAAGRRATSYALNVTNCSIDTAYSSPEEDD